MGDNFYPFIRLLVDVQFLPEIIDDMSAAWDHGEYLRKNEAGNLGKF
jgi:hypothetical protein